MECCHDGRQKVLPSPLSATETVRRRTSTRDLRPVTSGRSIAGASEIESGADSRTFVAVDAGRRVMGYCALAAGAVSHRASPGSVRRNMPDPVPVMVLARLAVDRGAQGKQLGGGLLKDAVLRTLSIAENAGVCGLLVHAMHHGAKAFYLHYGFEESPFDPMTLMLRVPRR